MPNTKEWNWTAIGLVLGLLINAAAMVWNHSAANARLESKVDLLLFRLDKIEATGYTIHQARADQKSQELFNNMQDMRLRVVEEQVKSLMGTKR